MSVIWFLTFTSWLSASDSQDIKECFIVIIKKFVLFTLLLLSFCSLRCQAALQTNSKLSHPPYIGVFGGYGSTTWEGLVPLKENQNAALSMSTPIKVTEGGGVWGVFVGYEFIPQLAFELSYMRYPDANVSFDPMSLFSFMNDNLTTFKTKTETVDLKGKIMLPISNTRLRIYSSVGAAGVHRNDMLVNDWRLSPTFGAGLNYHVTEHFMAELGGSYTAGYGEAQLNPTDAYFPFLYSVGLRLAYGF
ncbi:outer membrane beta-barrel protein [Legionella brunensis]|uniref:OmpA-like transmembrane domain protein n=1 Tax=Legionella brunensis TaxID=29422 RepID=A0A0W0SL39_9GAMM|nr:outer membrane beta-barrel protein [Legionella brunensis]KTC84130.1 OmpA-like transmembrane domain protein [Legionella brunensis]